MDDDYNYLIKMPMDSVSEENILHINDNYNKKNNELKLVESTTIKQMWLHELELLKKEYNKLF